MLAFMAGPIVAEELGQPGGEGEELGSHLEQVMVGSAW